jgi:hypothetical protein
MLYSRIPYAADENAPQFPPTPQPEDPRCTVGCNIDSCSQNRAATYPVIGNGVGDEMPTLLRWNDKCIVLGALLASTSAPDIAPVPPSRRSAWRRVVVLPGD